MTNTDVTFLQYYRSCPYIRHDLYLPFIPASLQTLGRVECAVASAPAPPDLRTVNPLILTLIFSVPSGRLQKIGPEFFLPSSHLRFDLLFVRTHLDPFLLSFFPLPLFGQEFFLPLVFPQLEVCPLLSFCLLPRS